MKDRSLLSMYSNAWIIQDRIINIKNFYNNGLKKEYVPGQSSVAFLPIW